MALSRRSLTEQQGRWQRQYHNKSYKQGNGKMLFFDRNSSFPQHITSMSNTTKHGKEALTHASPFLKHLFSKMTVPILSPGKKFKTFSTCLETTYERSKCLVLSRRVQDPSATRTEVDVSPKNHKNGTKIRKN